MSATNPDGDLSALGDAVVKDFFDTLSPDEQRLFKATTLATALLDECKAAEALYKESSAARKIAEVLLPFINGVEQYGKALDVFANSNSILNAIWGSIRLVLLWGREFGEYFGKLAEMLESMGHILARLPRLPHLYPDNARLKEAVVNIYQDIFDFCVKAKHVFRTGKTHFCGIKTFKSAVGFTTALRLVWKPFKVQFGDIKDRIAKNVETIDAEADLAERELANKERRLDDARWSRSEASQRLIAEYIDGESMIQVNNWLAPANVSVNHKAASGVRHGGTGSWFLKGDAFSNWLKQDNSFLWLHAIPGAGKTVLASSIINYLQETEQSKDVGLAYFYCDYKDPQKQAPTKLLGTLLAALAKQNRGVYEEIKTFFLLQYQQSSTFTAEFDELLNNFSSFIGSHFKSVIIVVDALDEADKKEWSCLTHSLKTMHQQCHRLKVLVTSRNERAIARDFEGLPSTSIEEADVESDITDFTTAALATQIAQKKLKLRDPDLEQVILKTLLDGAKGMFQWVTCQIDALGKLRNDKAIRAALTNLPKTLQDTYTRILQRIEDDHPDDVEIVRRILRFLVRGIRNLALDELVEGVAINPDHEDTAMDFSAVDTDPEDMLELLGGLVTVSSDKVISLAHLSVKEFLVSEDLRKLNSTFWIAKHPMESELARTCLTYLCFEDFHEPLASGTDALKDRLNTYKFLRYASEAWAIHAQRSEKDGKQDDHVVELTMRLFESTTEEGDRNFESWVEAFRSLKKRTGLVAKPGTQPLYYAAFFGLTQATRQLVEEVESGTEVLLDPLKGAVLEGHVDVVRIFLEKLEAAKALSKKKTETSGSDDKFDLNKALYLAAANGHCGVIELLLDHGAKVNAKGGKDGTALQRAAYLGRSGAVHLLLSRGASHVVSDKRYGTPLAAAAEKAHQRTAAALLERGANPNGRGGWYSFPLTAAVVGRNADLVHMLIEHGADVNARGGRHGSPLIAAAAQNMDELIEELVAAGARVNDEDDKSSDALYAASLAGHLTTVNLLLSLGADVNAKGGKHRNALGAASSEGHVRIVQRLLDAGADATFSDEHYGTPLQIAAQRGHGEVVRVLVAAGADPSADGGEKGSALVRAAAAGQNEMIKTLHDLGVDVTPEGDGVGALVAAAYAGLGSTIELLLDLGGDYNYLDGKSETKSYCNPMQAAASKGHFDIVTLLLNRGDTARLSADEGWYGTALIAAINTDDRSLEVVEALLTTGDADPDLAAPSKSHSYGTPLVHAVRRRDVDVINLLIKHGADVNLQYESVGTAIQAAAAISDTEILDILLEQGGDVNIAAKPEKMWDELPDGLVEKGGITPLQVAAINGHDDMVQRLIHLDAALTIDVSNAPFSTALQAAAYGGNMPTLETILRKTDDVNERGGYLGTALQVAVARRHEEVARRLLAAGADANDVGIGYYGSSLIAACSVKLNPKTETFITMLLEAGADVNGRAKRYPFPFALQALCEFHDYNSNVTDIMALLLRNGADPNLVGGVMGTALQTAAAKGSKGMTFVLLQHGADPNVTGGKWYTAMQAAFTHGYYEVIPQLWSAGARMDLRGGLGGSIMGTGLGLETHTASYGCCPTLIHQLVRTLQYDVNLPYYAGRFGNALQDAVLCNRSDRSFYHILNAGANINEAGGREGTPLAIAARQGNEEYVRYLLDHGADVNLGSEWCPNAAFGALRGQEPAMLKIVLEAGADVKSARGRHGTALQAAAWYGKPGGKHSLHLVRMIVAAGAEVNPALPPCGRHGTPLQAAIAARNEDVVRYLINRGADVRATGGRFGSALNAAVLNSPPQVVELLLKKGASPAERGTIHATPLQGAAVRGSLEIVLLLLRAGADVNARGGKYHTALQAACMGRSLAIVKALVEHGAEVNVEAGGYHGSALQAAAVMSREDTVQYLLGEAGATFKLVDRRLARWKRAFEAADEMLERVHAEQVEDDAMGAAATMLGGDGTGEVANDGGQVEAVTSSGSNTANGTVSSAATSVTEVEEVAGRRGRAFSPLNVESIPGFQRPWKKHTRWDDVRDRTLHELRQRSIMTQLQELGRLPLRNRDAQDGSNGDSVPLFGDALNGSSTTTARRGSTWPKSNSSANGSADVATNGSALKGASRSMTVGAKESGDAHWEPAADKAEDDTGELDEGWQSLTLLPYGELVE